MKPALMRLITLRAAPMGVPAPGTLRPAESIDAVWRHIEECLVTWADHAGQELRDLPESGLNSRLVTALECSPGERPYFFQPEYPEDKAVQKSS
jgi:hypothetical protein